MRLKVLQLKKELGEAADEGNVIARARASAAATQSPFSAAQGKAPRGELDEAV